MVLLCLAPCGLLAACTQSTQTSTEQAENNNFVVATTPPPTDDVRIRSDATPTTLPTTISPNKTTIQNQASQKGSANSPSSTTATNSKQTVNTQTSKKAASTVPSPTQNTTKTKPVVPSDPVSPPAVKHRFDPNVNLSSVDWGQAIALGNVHNEPVPDAGIVGPPMSDGKTLRLGKVPDPKGSGRQVIEYAAEYNANAAYRDPLFSDGTRVQVNHSLDAPGGLRRNVGNWHAFRVMHSDFGNGSDQQILMQYHDGDHSSGLNPYLAWLHKGDELTIFTKHSEASSNIKANHEDGPRIVLNSPPNVWENWVVHSKVAKNGFVKIWRNGKLVMNYSGPFGYYNQPIGGDVIGDYAALSYYHWHSGNAFDTSTPIRRVWWEWSSIVEDPSNTYDFEDMYKHMENNIDKTLPR